MSDSYNALHTVLEAAVNAMLLVTPCAEIDLVMSPPYSITETGIAGADYRVECKIPLILPVYPIPPEAIVNSIEIAWDIPTAREDGTALPIPEIYGYRLAATTDTGKEYTVDIIGAETLYYRLTGLEAGTYKLKIATIDSDMLVGNYSAEITQTLP